MLVLRHLLFACTALAIATASFSSTHAQTRWSPYREAEVISRTSQRGVPYYDSGYNARYAPRYRDPRYASSGRSYDPRLLAPDYRAQTIRRVQYQGEPVIIRGSEPADLRPRLNSPPPLNQTFRFDSPCQTQRSYAPSPYTTRYEPRIGGEAPPRDAYQPLLPLAAPPSRYYVGQGLIGQPKVYVPGQPVRNFFRYVLP